MSVMNKSILYIAASSLLIGLLSSCGGSSAEHYADKFCSCSLELARANIQYKNKIIDQATYQKIEQEHNACLGESDPLEALSDSPEEQQVFEMEFLQAIEKKCPDIARDMGF